MPRIGKISTLLTWLMKRQELFITKYTWLFKIVAGKIKDSFLNSCILPALKIYNAVSVKSNDWLVYKLSNIPEQIHEDSMHSHAQLLK